MISLYSGTPGSGKSLHTAKVILDRALLGKALLSNFPVKLPDKPRYKKASCLYVPNDKLTPDFLISFSQGYFTYKKFREGAILLIIDECQLLFNAREWQQSGRAAWLSFFTQHRKYGYNIILVAQFDRMIDRQIRSLIEYEYVHRKVGNFGIAGTVLSILSGAPLFVSVERWYPLKERIGSEFFHARKKYWSIYDSYGTFGTSAPARVGVGGPTHAGVDGTNEHKLKQYASSLCSAFRKLYS